MKIEPITKKCSRCLIIKPMAQFNAKSGPRDGKQARCKSCQSAVYFANREVLLEKNKKYREANKEKFLEGQRRSWHRHKEKRILESREYQAKNKESIKQQQKEYRQRNKELIAERNRVQYLKRLPARRVYAREYNSAKRARDPLFRLKENLRTRTSAAIRRQGYTKKSGLNELMGCDWETLRSHIEAQFTDGMSWGNYGAYWVIDHHNPLIGATCESELTRLCHYSNLKPLEKVENLRKGGKPPA